MVSGAPRGLLSREDALPILCKSHPDLPVQASQNVFQRVENFYFVADDCPTTRPQESVHLHNNHYGLLTSEEKWSKRALSKINSRIEEKRFQTLAPKPWKEWDNKESAASSCMM